MTDATPKTLSPAVVTQDDIVRAADFMDECAPYLGDCGMKNSVHLALRSTLARHRLASLASPERPVERERVVALLIEQTKKIRGRWGRAGSAPSYDETFSDWIVKHSGELVDIILSELSGRSGV